MSKKKTNKYHEMKERQEKTLNAFTTDKMFFAFSDKQFEEGMAKFGLTTEKEDLMKITSTGSGGYIRREHVQEFKDIFKTFRQEREQAIADAKTGEAFIFDMFIYELANHEYGYTREIDDTLDALGYTLEDIQANRKLHEGIVKAMKKLEKEGDY